MTWAAALTQQPPQQQQKRRASGVPFNHPLDFNGAQS